MAYRNKTYVIFDGDNDIWAYRYMKGWHSLPGLDFCFYDAHSVGFDLTSRASEATIKARLRARFSNAREVVVLVGEQTRHLYRFVRWELEVALDLDIPIVAANLNGKRELDSDLCPPIIRSEYVVHVPFRMKIVQHALENFPARHRRKLPGEQGPLHYPNSVY